MVKEHVASGKKIYCIDTGLACVKAFKLSSDFGRLYKNIMAVELKKLEMGIDISIHYWKLGQQEEVDFVVKQGLKVKKLIQICYNIDDRDKKRVRALLKASKAGSTEKVVNMNILIPHLR